MEFGLDPSFDNLRQMIGWLGKDKLRPLGIEADRQGHALPSDHPFFKEVLAMGLTGGFVGKMGDAAPRPDDDGRIRRSNRRAVVMAEEAAYWDRGMATSLPGPSLGGPPVMMMGNEDQKKRFLGIFEGAKEPHWGAFAMSEPGAGSDVARISTRAVQDGDHWVIDGEKCFISNGARASWIVVWATIDPSLGRAGHRAFVVERGTPGFSVVRIEKKMGLTASETAGLLFEHCRVPVANMLQGSDRSKGGDARKSGFVAAMKTFDMTRPLVAAMAVGMGQAVYDESLRFAREHLGGASAWRMDRVRDRLAWIERKLEAGRLLAWRAAWLADHKRPNATEASMAKAECASIALAAASVGMDVLGEAGGASDYLIEKLFRDIKALDLVEGTGQIQRVVIARKLIGFRGDRPLTTSQGEANV
jgi:acyl-CoA dehydrogenase